MVRMRSWFFIGATFIIITAMAIGAVRYSKSIVTYSFDDKISILDSGTARLNILLHIDGNSIQYKINNSVATHSATEVSQSFKERIIEFQGEKKFFEKDARCFSVKADVEYLIFVWIKDGKIVNGFWGAELNGSRRTGHIGRWSE